LEKSRNLFKHIIIGILLINFGLEYIYLTSILFLFTIYSEIFKNLKIILLCTLFLTLYYIFGLEKTDIGNYFLLLIFLISLITSKNSIKINLNTNFISVVVLINILILIFYPGATQSLNFESLTNELDIPRGLQLLLINTIGSFVIVLISLNKGNKKLYVLTFIFLLLSAKTTSILLYLCGLIIKYFSFKKSSLISLFSIIFLMSFLIMNFDPPEYIQNRLEILAEFDANAEELIRFPLALVSIQTFLENPFFGIGFYKENVDFATDFLLSPVGHHSHLFDGLARFGLIWLIVILIDLKRFTGINIFLVLIWFVLNNVIGFEWLILSLINLNNEKESSFSARY
tara:strand:+ start:1987 stop:3015 length:1029 start_codon:yes stop_codon:yes gene_type:complete